MSGARARPVARSRAVPRPPPSLPRDAHKGTAGRVLCVCGSREMPGAAVLAARSAQRGGAGLVTVACADRELLSIVPIAAPEAILLDLVSSRRFPSGRADHARLAGPGLGATARTRRLVRALLADGSPVPLVLDADALNVLGTAVGGLRAHAGPVVLTPHPGEAARLLGREVPSDARGRADAARELSARSGAICVLKGAGTVVAEGERVYVNATGNPGMATAGAGDVLAGLLVAYLASCSTGLDARWTPFEAAASAVHVHGLAGDLARREVGERALVASDLVAFLGAAQLVHSAR